MSETISEHILLPSGTVKKLVILLHGYGQMAEYMRRKIAVPGAAMLAEYDIAWHMPNAPHPCKDFPEGRDWLYVPPGTPWTPSVKRHRAEEVVAWITAYAQSLCAQYNLTWKDVVLGGFSQGGAVSLCTGIQQSIGCAGIVLWSGALHKPDEYLSGVDITAVPTCIIYGKKDDVLKESYYDETAGWLVTHGVPCERHVIDAMEHRITEPAMQAGCAFIGNIFKGTL